MERDAFRRNGIKEMTIALLACFLKLFECEIHPTI